MCCTRKPKIIGDYRKAGKPRALKKMHSLKEDVRVPVAIEKVCPCIEVREKGVANGKIQKWGGLKL